MVQTRREWLAGTAATVAGWTLGPSVRPARAETKPVRFKIGACDWSLDNEKPDVFDLAKQIGLDGVQVSVGNAGNRLWLRQPKVQKEYLESARKTGLQICSLAMGVLNNVPLKSEPRAALWIADAIEVARAMGVKCMLLAFFGKGDLAEANDDEMRRVTDALEELAPRAEKAGVVLGLENTISAETNLKIIEQVRSKAVQVYYDFYNLGVSKGYDWKKELKLLGSGRICEVHFKDRPSYLEGGKVDWRDVVATLKDIGYDGWIVLETRCPHDVVADMRKNLEYVRKLLNS